MDVVKQDIERIGGNMRQMIYCGVTLRGAADRRRTLFLMAAEPLNGSQQRREYSPDDL